MVTAFWNSSATRRVVSDQVETSTLHANVSCKAHEREQLEHMVRYIARPPVAIDRLHKRNDGLITYRLKKKYRDGTERLLFSPLELLEKLAALVPSTRRK